MINNLTIVCYHQNMIKRTLGLIHLIGSMKKVINKMIIQFFILKSHFNENNKEI